MFKYEYIYINEWHKPSIGFSGVIKEKWEFYFRMEEVVYSMHEKKKSTVNESSSVVITTGEEGFCCNSSSTPLFTLCL
jgi:hypothetical protein